MNNMRDASETSMNRPRKRYVRKWVFFLSILLNLFLISWLIAGDFHGRWMQWGSHFMMSDNKREHYKKKNLEKFSPEIRAFIESHEDQIVDNMQAGRKAWRDFFQTLRQDDMDMEVLRETRLKYFAQARAQNEATQTALFQAIEIALETLPPDQLNILMRYFLPRHHSRKD